MKHTSDYAGTIWKLLLIFYLVVKLAYGLRTGDWSGANLFALGFWTGFLAGMFLMIDDYNKTMKGK